VHQEEEEVLLRVKERGPRAQSQAEETFFYFPSYDETSYGETSYEETSLGKVSLSMEVMERMEGREALTRTEMEGTSLPGVVGEV
jgi:hypothetical protein